MLIGRFKEKNTTSDITQTDSRILMAKRLKTLGWMTIWKVDLGDDGGLPGAHWSADYKA